MFMTVAVTYSRPGNDHIIVVFQWHTYSVFARVFFLIPRKLFRTLSLSLLSYLSPLSSLSLSLNFYSIQFK